MSNLLRAGSWALAVLASEEAVEKPRVAGNVAEGLCKELWQLLGVS